MYKIGVVVGKFLPFHLGHKFLIDTALSQCDTLYVILCYRTGEPISAIDRFVWLLTTYGEAPNVVLMYCNIDEYDEEPETWARLTREWVGQTPDAIFSSEPYGDDWARALGCKNVCVDMARTAIPISGTLVRSDPAKYKEYLPRIVQEYYDIL